jgi:hypothetical protein
MGDEVVGGLIDTGASLAQSAVSAAAAAGTFGAGAAAGPAASQGIQIGAQIAKRVSSYGFQLASIGADSLVEQLFPLGAPRFIGYDYTQFAPNLNIMGAATTSLEKMGNQAISRYFNPQGQTGIPAVPQSPAAMSGPQEPGQLNRMDITGVDQPAVSGTLGGGPTFNTGETPPPAPAVAPNPTDAGGGGGGGSWLLNPNNNLFGRANGGHIGIYDNGGVLNPGDLAYNASKTPENILTKQQWNAMAANASTSKDAAPMVKIDNIYGMSPDDVANKIEAKQKLAMMRYAGRP